MSISLPHILLSLAVGVVFKGTLSVSNQDNICLCPPEHKEKHPVIFCGKEINYIYKNKNCDDERQYRCKGAGLMADVRDFCPSERKVCGRDYGKCISTEGCYYEKFTRMCYPVDRPGISGASSKCHKKHYQLDGKGKLCCDQEFQKKVNPDVNPSCYD